MSLLSVLPKSLSKENWPWTEEVDPSIYSNRESWPKISIITPSYNQGDFIEETIRSILLQNYPNIEYIIIDGGSTDKTVEVIKKYSSYLTYWVSEKDRGQSDAINKGLNIASGELIAYLNSDDWLFKDTLYNVAETFLLNCHLNNRKLILVGDALVGQHVNHEKTTLFSNNSETWDMPSVAAAYGIGAQPSIFWYRSSLSFNEDLRFAMDFDYWYRLVKDGYKAVKIPLTLSFYRIHKDSKSVNIQPQMWIENSFLAIKWVEDFPKLSDKAKQFNAFSYKMRLYFIGTLKDSKTIWTRWDLIKFILFQLFNFPGILFHWSYLKFLLKKLIVGPK